MVERVEKREKTEDIEIKPIMEGSKIFRIIDKTGFIIFLNLEYNPKEEQAQAPFLVIPKRNNKGGSVAIVFGDGIEFPDGKIGTKKYNRVIQTTKIGLDLISRDPDYEDTVLSPAGRKVMSMVNSELEGRKAFV